MKRKATVRQGASQEISEPIDHAIRVPTTQTLNGPAIAVPQPLSPGGFADDVFATSTSNPEDI